MDFGEVREPRFGVSDPPKPYPENPLDRRSGNYTNSDVDYSKDSSVSSGDSDVLHQRSDLNSSRRAQHHTLGPNRNEASPGDHTHDGTLSKLVGSGMEITISGSRGGNAALASLIAALKLVIDITDNTTP